MQKQKKKLSVAFIITIIAIILIAVSSVFGFRYTQNNNYEYITAGPGEILEEILVSGTVKASEEIDLAFEQTGRLDEIHADVNDPVLKNQILLELDHSELDAQLDSANATIQAELAFLNELRSGTRSEELAVSQNSVDNALKNLNNAKSVAQEELAKKQQELDAALQDYANTLDLTDINLDKTYSTALDAINEAVIDADDAIYGQTSILIDDSVGSSTDLTFDVATNSIETAAENSYTDSVNELNDLVDIVAPLSSSDHEEIDLALSTTKSTLQTVKAYLTDLSRAVEDEINLSDTTKANYHSYISTARSSVETAISNINSQVQLITLQKVTNESELDSAQNKIDNAESSLILQEATNQNNIESAQNSLEQAKKELSLQESGTRSETIATQEAKVSKAMAEKKLIEARIEKTIIRSPIDGIITDITVDIGELVTSQTTVISVISQTEYEIEAEVSELDIGKIENNDKAEIIFDAYRDTPIMGSVTSIDPAETIVDGVSVYLITIMPDDTQLNLRPGMTATITITTHTDQAEVTLPRYVISADSTIKIIDSNGNIEHRFIQLGKTGSDGITEILSGISPNEKVLITTE